MATKLEICNLAVDRLGGTPMTALTDNSKTARLCNQNFDLLRDYVLRDYPWEFARARANLALDASAPAFGFDHQHELPSDFIRLVSIHSSDGAQWPATEPWAVEQNMILSNSDTMYIKYIKRIEDTSRFSPDFAVSLSLKIAQSICYSLTGSQQLAGEIRAEYVNSLQMAKFVGSATAEPEQIEAEAWINARS